MLKALNNYRCGFKLQLEGRIVSYHFNEWVSSSFESSLKKYCESVQNLPFSTILFDSSNFLLGSRFGRYSRCRRIRLSIRLTYIVEEIAVLPLMLLVDQVRALTNKNQDISSLSLLTIGLWNTFFEVSSGLPSVIQKGGRFND